MILQNKQIATVIAQQDFRDEEYFLPRAIFEAAGFEVKTVSLNRGEAIGAFGSMVEVDLALDDVKAADYAAVVFVGGDGMEKLMDNRELRKLAKAAVKQDRVVAAICIGPAVLAKAGVLQGKRATVWASEGDQTAVEILRDNGAQYVPEVVVIDGNIITARDVNASRKFGEEIVRILKN